LDENIVTAETRKSLSDATVQEIQLDLIRRACGDGFNGDRVVTSLLAHRHLWEAVLMDRFCFSRPGGLPGHGLIKLRDLADNYWNVDTLYILTPDASHANELARIVETEDWGGMLQIHADSDDVSSALGSSREKRAVISIWWD
jgi:hypothetical protein